ncbi:MAG: peptidoglycan-binding protein [Candidatus Pacebacteria bacterium]|nr:peptidoglycan-binding protein [Candidatus Paceibacterota bacterium]
MQITANTVVAKLSVAFVAIAMMFTVASPASAQTTEELQQMINDLLAQVASLQGQLGGGTMAAPAAGVCPYTWTRSLSTGDSGMDVMKLQQFLNADADTRIAATGVGSAGMESDYFGGLTAAAVSKFQTKYRSEVLSPAGLVNPTGYFGPSTMAKANALCVSAPMTDDSSDDSSDDSDDSSDDSGITLSGEASLDTFEIDDADDSDVEEGQSDVEIAEVTIEFADGDAEISRLDLAFTDSEGTDSDAWDVFESFSLWVDGDMVAEEAADDEDDYLGDEDNGVIRFGGLDIVGMEDEEVTIVVAATISDNLETAELGEWDVDGESIRFFDADGVATTEDATPVTDDTATFNIEVEGAGDDLDMKSNSNDPPKTTLVLDENDNTTHTVFIFDLDADDSDGDITLEEITIDLALGSTTRDLNEVVDDVTIEIDGQSFDAEDFDGVDDTEAVKFDIDGDVTIAEGEEVSVEVMVEFKDMDSDSDLQGTTLEASIDTADVDAEGESGKTVALGGTNQTGEAHTLRSEGLVLTITEVDAEEEQRDTGSGDRDYGTYTFTFDVTAFGENFYMIEDDSIVNFDILVDGVAMASPSASSTASLDINDAEDAATADKMIEDGETAEFVLTVETGTDIEGDVEVRVNFVAYSATDAVPPYDFAATATPEDDWTSDSLILN